MKSKKPARQKPKENPPGDPTGLVLVGHFPGDTLSDILVDPEQNSHPADSETDRQARIHLSRTYEPDPLEHYIPGSTIGIASHRFYGAATQASIDERDLPRLEPGEWLTVGLVNFFLYEVANSYLEQTPGAGRALCALPEAIWSSSNSSQGRYTPLPRRDRQETPLDFDFVAFPGNCTNNHYYLCIIAYASDLLVDRNPGGEIRTVGLVLNSYIGIGPSDAEQRFRNVVLRLGKKHPLRNDGINGLRVYFPNVPQQRNGYDCGLYPGHFLSIFMSDPEKYLRHCTGENVMDGTVDDVWAHDKIKSARENLRDLVHTSIRIRAATHRYNTEVPSHGTKKGYY